MGQTLSRRFSRHPFAAAHLVHDDATCGVMLSPATRPQNSTVEKCQLVPPFASAIGGRAHKAEEERLN
jgi:hypothetical protein